MRKFCRRANINYFSQRSCFMQPFSTSQNIIFVSIVWGYTIFPGIAQSQDVLPHLVGLFTADWDNFKEHPSQSTAAHKTFWINSKLSQDHYSRRNPLLDCHKPVSVPTIVLRWNICSPWCWIGKKIALGWQLSVQLVCAMLKELLSIISHTLSWRTATISAETNKCVSSKSSITNFLPKIIFSSRWRRNCFTAGSLKSKVQ